MNLKPFFSVMKLIKAVLTSRECFWDAVVVMPIVLLDKNVPFLTAPD